MRTFPLLALIPLFQLWFGLTFLGMMLFVAYGVAVIFFTGTVNAVNNVSPVYRQNARTLGASRLRMYRTVILPVMFPELRSSILLSIGVAWTAVVGAEFLGAQTGLGQIIVYAKYFGYVDRMFLVGLILLVYAALTFAIFERASRPLIAWMPGPMPTSPPKRSRQRRRRSANRCASAASWSATSNAEVADPRQCAGFRGQLEYVKSCDQRIRAGCAPHVDAATQVTYVNTEAGPQGIDSLLDRAIAGLESRACDRTAPDGI